MNHPPRVSKGRLIHFKPFGYFSPLFFEVGDAEIEFLQFDERGKLWVQRAPCGLRESNIGMTPLAPESS
ncbi:MAG: hypothetical protein LZF60_120032 [Nitrospira sp.]|nr:MAG: hypothetical protein LZF60_120032 [Nitrospira sp.]